MAPARVPKARLATFGCAVVLFAFGQVPPRAAEPKVGREEFAKLKAQAGVEGGTADGLAYLKDSAKALETAIDAAFGRCSAQLAAEKTPGFEFIARIGTDGATREVVILPDDAFTSCFARAFGSTELGAPPSDPFHVYVGMRAEE